MELVTRPADMFQATAASQHLNYTLHIDPAVPPVVITSAHRLQEILANLIGRLTTHRTHGPCRGIVAPWEALTSTALPRVSPTHTHTRTHRLPPPAANGRFDRAGNAFKFTKKGSVAISVGYFPTVPTDLASVVRPQPFEEETGTLGATVGNKQVPLDIRHYTRQGPVTVGRLASAAEQTGQPIPTFPSAVWNKMTAAMKRLTSAIVGFAHSVAVVTSDAAALSEAAKRSAAAR